MLSGGVAGYQPWKTTTENGVDYASYGGSYAEGKCQQTFGFEWEDASAPSAEVAAALEVNEKNSDSDNTNFCSKTGSDINTKLHNGKTPYCDLIALGIQANADHLADGGDEKYNMLKCENSNWNFKSGQLRLRSDSNGVFGEASCQIKCRQDKGWSGYGPNTGESRITCKPVYDNGNLIGAVAEIEGGHHYLQQMCGYGCEDWALRDMLGYTATHVDSDTCGARDLHKRQYYQPGSECALGCEDSSNNDVVTDNVYKCRCTDGTGHRTGYRVCDWAVKVGSKWFSPAEVEPANIGECKTDECANNDDNCDVHATCTDEDAGFSCACNSGWEGDGDSCEDINECDTGDNNCDSNATCGNTAGGYSCACNNGFTGDGESCEDIDECADFTDNCSSNAQCTNNAGGFSCACNSGYEGSGVSCSDIDECETGDNECDSNASCNNNDGGYDCSCNSGFEGSGLECSDIDECDTGDNDCDANASCDNTVGGFDCNCNAGYSGSGQECSDIDECDTGDNSCDANASCTNNVGSYDCTCNAGWSGDGNSCEDVDECANADLNSCDALATCTNNDGGYSCQCNDGYQGTGFECEDIDECLEANACVPNADCTNSIGAFSCACSDGFEGDASKECRDINECLDDPCDPNASCDNTEGGFECECNEGWYGDGFFCKDIDECALGVDQCDDNAQCKNTIFRGGYDCECNDGWEGDGFSCTDVDECANADLNNCDANASCTNNDGGFSCACNAGFRGDGVSCADINECTEGSDDCNGNAKCSNTVGGFECICNSGFEGSGHGAAGCQDIDECTRQIDSCDSNASCTNFAGGYNCACNNGFEGDGYSCDDIDECLGETDCVADSSCNNLPGTYECNCNKGYSGDGKLLCEDKDECKLYEDDCSDDGVCTNTVGSFTCACKSGFEGDGYDCTDINECEAGTAECGDNSSCENNEGGYDCPCDDGYFDNEGTCEDIDECLLDPCHELAECTNLPGTYQCKCALGFSGDGVSSCSVCPSDACWTYDEDARSCTRNTACSALSCGSTEMSFEFDANLFGLEEDMEVQWAAEASPSWDAEKGRYALTLGLGASSEGIKFSIDQENDEITFSVLVAVDGSGRSRTSSVNKQVDVGNGKSIITAPFGIGVYFRCTYSTSIELSSDAFEYFEVGTTGGYETTGSLANGFGIQLNDGNTDTLTLGAFMPVSISWSISSLSGLRFYISSASVEHGNTNVEIVKNGCFAGAVEAKATNSSPTNQSFRYKIFKAQGESDQSQTVHAVIKLCAANDCSWPTANDCSNEGDDALYAFEAHNVQA